MSGYLHRLACLEALYQARTDDTTCHKAETVPHAWLASLSDADIEFMATIAEQLKAGASLEAMPPGDRERVQAGL